MVTVWDTMNTTYQGLSTDTKPTDARNGDIFAEMDTDSVYIFDEENAEWRECATGSGGSGGGGGGGSSTNFVVTFTMGIVDDNPFIWADKTAAEVMDAINAGSNVVATMSEDGENHIVMQLSGYEEYNEDNERWCYITFLGTMRGYQDGVVHITEYEFELSDGWINARVYFYGAEGERIEMTFPILDAINPDSEGE